MSRTIDIHPNGGFFLDTPGVFPGSSRVELNDDGVPHLVEPEPVAEPAAEPVAEPAAEPALESEPDAIVVAVTTIEPDAQAEPAPAATRATMTRKTSSSTQS